MSVSVYDSAVGVSISGGGSVTIDQVQALLTATIQQMGGTWAGALNGVKTGKDENALISGVKIKVQ